MKKSNYKQPLAALIAAAALFGAGTAVLSARLTTSPFPEELRSEIIPPRTKAAQFGRKTTWFLPIPETEP